MALPIAPTSPLLSTANGGSSTHHRRLLHLLTQCTDMSQLKQIHAQAIRATSTHDPTTLFLHSRILHFCSLADFEYAHKVFDQIPEPNSFMWNTLVRACARSTDRKEQAISIFRKMVEDGSVLPDNHSFPFLLKACAYQFALFEGKQAHAQVLKLGFGSDVYVNNSLVHLYASCGCLDDARKVFDEMPQRSIVSWNVMIDGFVQLGEFEMALKLFAQMLNSIEPDHYTLQSVISACSGLSAPSLGMWVHGYILRKSDPRVVNDVLVNSYLIDMYCKCGLLEIAKQVFERMPERNVASWNHMILGFAAHGEAEAALEYFTRMVESYTLKPDSITFVGVLSACNHRGMVTEGKEYFHMMINEFKIEPRLEHYGCLIDLYARGGLIDEALSLVSEMPIKPDAVIWRSLLDACCKKNEKIELSEEMARRILDSPDTNECSGVYVLLSRVYASANRWNDAGMVRKLMKTRGIEKEPGCSTMEVHGVTHEFFAGDTAHPRRNEIFRFLDVIEERLALEGYEPDCSQAHTVGESRKLHSERLAIAFGLLTLRPGTPVRVYKNLRVCDDCHEVTKLVSKIFNVEIIVRDRVRFHRFRYGACSCRDYCKIERWNSEEFLNNMNPSKNYIRSNDDDSSNKAPSFAKLGMIRIYTCISLNP